MKEHPDKSFVLSEDEARKFRGIEAELAFGSTLLSKCRPPYLEDRIKGEFRKSRIMATLKVGGSLVGLTAVLITVITMFMAVIR